MSRKTAIYTIPSHEIRSYHPNFGMRYSTVEVCIPPKRKVYPLDKAIENKLIYETLLQLQQSARTGIGSVSESINNMTFQGKSELS